MGFKGAPHIEVEGLKELQTAIKRSQGKLPASIGQAHKNVGSFIISKLPPGDPRAVGAGSGATVRPSATKRDVVLRVGHGGRAASRFQWGKTAVQPFTSGRPYIVGTVERYRKEIEQKFIDEIMKALSPAFNSASVEAGGGSERELVEYVSKSGNRSMVTRAQARNWGSRRKS